jgi:hypothetical protein
MKIGDAVRCTESHLYKDMKGLIIGVRDNHPVWKQTACAVRFPGQGDQWLPASRLVALPDNEAEALKAKQVEVEESRRRMGFY